MTTRSIYAGEQTKMKNAAIAAKMAVVSSE